MDAAITYEMFGSFPTEPYQAEYWIEWEFVGDEQAHGPPCQWVAWFTHRGEPLAMRIGGSRLMTARKIAERWGQGVLDEFKEHIATHFDANGEEYDSWVNAMERHWEAQAGK